MYIDKSALVAEIRSRLHPVEVPYGTNYDDWDRGADSERLNILSFIDTLEVKEVDLENRTKILADIIFDTAKNGYMPYDTQDEHCAMEKARRNIIKLI